MLDQAAAIQTGTLACLCWVLFVVAIMLGFPTEFTLMGMGMLFGWFAYQEREPGSRGFAQILAMMVQRTYAVMSNECDRDSAFRVHGYLVERANLIEKMFRSLHLAMARVPGSLAVATIVTCAIFATDNRNCRRLVTLMGLLAFTAMIKAGYNVKVGAGQLPRRG